jgi:hypothetical protein
MKLNTKETSRKFEEIMKEEREKEEKLGAERMAEAK